MNNPFEINSNNIKTGFYYDRRLRVLCYIYVEEGTEMFPFSTVKTYNRLIKPVTSPHPMMIPTRIDPKETNAKDVEEITQQTLEECCDLRMDFIWICTNKKVQQQFINFLLNEEKYMILDLFKTFVESKTQNK